MTEVATRSLGAALFLGLIGTEVGAAKARMAGAGNASVMHALPNELTRNEMEKGWELLFNGKDLSGWIIRDSSLSKLGWGVRDSALAFGGSGSNTLLSARRFQDFELTLEWKGGMGADAGIFLRVESENVEPGRSAPEVQLVDNLWNSAAMEPKNSAGACNHLYAPSQDATRPIGEWNSIKVVAQGRKIEHWLNDAKIVEYEIGSEDWNSRLGRSVLKAYKDLGTAEHGLIGLQSGTTTRFRAVKIRPLGAPIAILSRHRQPKPAVRAAFGPGFNVTEASGLRDLRGRLALTVGSAR